MRERELCFRQRSRPVSDVLSFLLGVLTGFVVAAAILSPRLRGARSALRTREAELASARETERRLREEAEALRGGAEDRNAEILADNADLRRRMDELADAILARHGRPGDQSG